MCELACKKYHFHKKMFTELHRIEIDDNLKYFVEEYILSQAPLTESLEKFRSFIRMKLSNSWGYGACTAREKSEAIKDLMDDEQNMEFMSKLWK